MEQNVDTVVCLTDGDAAEYRHARRVTVIPNYLSLTASTDVETASQQHHIVALGRLEKANGYDLLIRAWQQIYHDLPDCSLHIYGEGREREPLQTLINALQLEESVTLHSATDNPTAVYRSADIVCVTSEYEGFSLVIIEAMANGVPVVACDVPHGPRHLLGEGRGGMLVERTPEAIGKAVLAIKNDSELHSRLASEGPDIAAQYSRERVMRLWAEEINKAI